MQDSVVLRAQGLREMLRSFDAGQLSGADCAVVVEELAKLEKACAAAKAAAAARAASCGAHRKAGFADPVDWLARTSGTSAGEAKAALATMAALEDCPATREGLAAGELSLDQAAEITKTEAARPGSEAELVALAHTAGLATLRDKARTRRHEAIGAEELHRRQRAARSFRHWRTDLGMIAFAGQLPPETGVSIVNRLDAECDRIRRRPKRAAATSGEPVEAREAYAADALVDMLSGTGGRAKGTDLVVVVDINAYRRGHTHDGEACHIVGGGPIPVEVARELGKDAFVKCVLHDGVAIHTVAHYGRYMKAELRTALELGEPPEFNGVVCADEGCDRRYGLEWDHVDPVANNGPTSYANLKPRCWPGHQAKTERDRQAGLLQPRLAPPGPDPP